MKRRLFLIINDGGIRNYLPNVKTDKENYLRFFHSPEGGAWEENEIEISENNFDFSRFENHIHFQEYSGDPYDFLLIVFCGHGFSQDGERYIEIRPDETFVSLTQIKTVCSQTRTLFISDSCLATLGNLNEVRGINGVHRFSTDEYRQICQLIYNTGIMLTPNNTFTAGFAVSIGEKAGENENGGIYSQTLLEEAREVIEELKTNPVYANDNYASFSFVHYRTAQKVVRITNGDQHPSIELKRSRYLLPFVVVPKD